MEYLCSSGIIAFPMHDSVVYIFRSVSLITFFHLPNPAEQPFSILLTLTPILSNNNPAKLVALLQKLHGEFITNKEAFN